MVGRGTAKNQRAGSEGRGTEKENRRSDEWFFGPSLVTSASSTAAASAAAAAVARNPGNRNQELQLGAHVYFAQEKRYVRARAGEGRWVGVVVAPARLEPNVVVLLR